MSFVNNARTRAASLPFGNEEKLVLDFLIVNGVGRMNAQPWGVLEAYLSSNGVSMTQQRFQQGILKQTRENDVFIGSNDHGRSRGYFLIDTIQDAEMMRDWYQRRIDTEQNRLDNLRTRAASRGWRI